MKHIYTPEQWRPVVGYEGHYEVSDHGRVRSIERKTWFINRWGQEIQRVVPAKIRELSTHPNGGHQYLTLHRDGKRKQWFVHQLVLLSFAGERPEGANEVRHLDGNPKNNFLDNLAYGSHGENVRDMQQHGTHRNARKTECNRGHLFDEHNTYWRPDGKGRSCIACMKAHGKAHGAEYQRAYRRRQRAL